MVISALASNSFTTMYANFATAERALLDPLEG
jgi:hypothetical protein